MCRVSWEVVGWLCVRETREVRFDLDGWLLWSLDRGVTETALNPSLNLSWASQCRNTLKHLTMKTLFDRRLETTQQEMYVHCPCGFAEMSLAARV